MCKVHLESIPGSPYSQARNMAPKCSIARPTRTTTRTWREKCTVDARGQVAIPSMAMKQCIDTAAYKLGIKVPNRRGATYKNFFASGFFANSDVPIANGKALTKADAVMVSINANADGVRGSGKRVRRRFPEFAKWAGVAEFTITDDIITPEIFETHVKASGLIVGVGRFRPENGGRNGRFRAVKFEWNDISL